MNARQWANTLRQIAARPDKYASDQVRQKLEEAAAYLESQAERLRDLEHPTEDGTVLDDELT